jgi:hypothetical protein
VENDVEKRTVNLQCIARASINNVLANLFSLELKKKVNQNPPHIGRSA